MNSLIEENKNQTVSENDSFTTKRYEVFYSYLKKNHKRILDFGCNTGRGSAVLKGLNEKLEIIGADIVKERLSKIPNGIFDEIIDLSVDNFLYKKKQHFDAILSGEVVEHIPFPELILFLQYFHKILNLDGVLILTTPNPNSLLVKLGRKSVLTDPSHVNIMNRFFLKDLLNKLGYKNISITGSGKAVKYFGSLFPLFFVYGSYQIVAYK